ncbi:MAG TPA: aminotransferase class V-fold PLP-dependent enzyme [Solirubrobacteraceae bacterium]|nr:aminotransferase class V-fold PLP-dependent enzyme [Solirubrobacteraceae bacterium]
MTDATTSATDPTTFRAQFPVLKRLSYLNAGTEGPIPRAAADAVRCRIDAEADGGRCGRPYFEELMALADRARAGYATALGCEPTDVALTGSTTDGVNTVIGGLDLRPGDEIVTSDQEHPGLLAPLGRARKRHGVKVRVVPFAEIAGEVKSTTRLIACSHVSWVGGEVADVPALVATGVPVLLDAAQALGAVPIDVGALGVDFYAGSGQKWLCGPEGSGALFVREDRLDDLLVPWPGYGSVMDPANALEFEQAEGVKRLDHGFPAGMRSAWAGASLGVFEEAGWDWVHERAASMAARLAARLAERGLSVSPRGRSTLVSWAAGDADAEVARLAGESVIVRSIPAFGLVRASVGAWTSEDEIDRLVSLAAA